MIDIKYSSVIVSRTKKDGDIIEQNHRRFSEIGTKNLKDFNERMNVRIRLEYNEINNAFSILNISNNKRLQYFSRKFLIELNRYITLIKVHFDQSFIKNEYVQGVERDANNLKQEIRAKHKIQNGNVVLETEKVECLKLIEEFINLRKNSYPISVITDKMIIKNCINEINALYDDLSKEFIVKTK
ncbi:MAG: hypothetical protein ACSHW7_12345 [Patiriisocius sp.]|uniref:hypothetical protein n=1 Tax=Patiriisocius sp. TaxID=2822396 RepID=UPI003EF0AE56